MLFPLSLLNLFILFFDSFSSTLKSACVCVCVQPQGFQSLSSQFWFPSTFSPSNLLFPSFYILNIELFQNYNIKNAPISQYVFQLFLSALPFNVFKKNNAPNLSNISKLSAIFIFYYKNLVLF